MAHIVSMFFFMFSIHAMGTAALAVTRAANPLVVDLGYAQYQGIYNATSGINSWYGIHYAAAPIGNLRWAAPVDIVKANNYSTSGVIDATTVGPACYNQYPAWIGAYNVSADAGQSEDCLLLDVKVPANPTSNKLPVVIQIHGGGYTLGSAETIGPGDSLVYQSAGSMIYVSIQYRLGAYGFLGGADVAEHGTLNAGLLDQRLAIEWVNQHISAFGGDASHITITGASAGGGSVTNQMIMYGGEANPPFQAVLAEYPWWQPYKDSYEQERQYNLLLSLTNCSDLTCLRALNGTVLFSAVFAMFNAGYAEGLYGYGDFWFGPVVDGYIIRDLPGTEFLLGHFTRVPLLVDHEGYEGAIFSNRSETTMQEEVQDLDTLWPNARQSFFDRLYQIYPISDFNSTFFQRQQIFGDAFVSCPTYFMATAVSDYGPPVWKLIFDAGTELHGSTGPFLYSRYIDATGNNATIATIMRDYYISFFVHNDPNTQSFSNITKPYWNSYLDQGGFNVMDVNYTMIGNIPDPDAKTGCDFFHAQGNAIRN